jgi:hypothetical protein
MSQPEPNEPAPRSGGLLAGWTVIILLLLYALSAGPVLKFCGRNPPDAVYIVYAPLEYLSRHISPVAKFYDWYLNLWGAE